MSTKSVPTKVWEKCSPARSLCLICKVNLANTSKAKHVQSARHRTNLRLAHMNSTQAHTLPELQAKVAAIRAKVEPEPKGVWPHVKSVEQMHQERLASPDPLMRDSAIHTATALGMQANAEAAAKAERPFVPSPQQQAVFDWVRRERGNAFIEAVAGAGKTTTLLEVCKLLTPRSEASRKYHSVAYAAYNRKIANEVKAKLAAMKAKGIDVGYVEPGTFHSFGFKAWTRVYRDCKVAEDDEKSAMMAVELKVPEELQTFVDHLISLAKNDACMKDWQPQDRARWHRLIEHHDLAEDLENPEQVDTGVDFAIKGIRWHRDKAPVLIDFDDMIWLPIVTDIRVWQHNAVLVDEAQDTNAARRHMARRMCHPTWGRLIFVGDRHQAIYGFTGADNDSIDKIVQEFRCKELPLTVTYRCPQLVVQKAQQYVSHIEAHPSAPAGTVSHMTAKDFLGSVKGLLPTDAILCRKTAPIVSLAFQLLRKGVACHVEGRDIGKGLIALATRWKTNDIDRLRERLERWRDRQVKKLQAKGKGTQAEQVADRVECLLVLAEGCHDVECVTLKIKQMFADTTGDDKPTLTLCTAHRAKGMEWQRVFILGFNEYMPSKYARQPWQLEQETNLIYVAITRSQDQLFTVDALDGPRGGSK